MDHRRKRNEEHSEDSPPYSRLFIVCEKRSTEDQIRDAFSEFGHIQDIYMPRHHESGENKGIAFIKFAKTTEAANALEEMHMKVISNMNRPLKVMVAANRTDIQSDDDSDDKYKRLFINIPKTATESVIEEHFGQFGDIESIQIQRDRNTGDVRGFAYVKYRTFSAAAQAFEGCDAKYRAIFAQPKGFKSRRHETSYETNISHLAESSSTVKTSLISAMNTGPNGYTRIYFMCSPYLQQVHVERLFDIVPGMTDFQYFVDLMRNFGKGTVTYSNQVAASYAVQKLNMFEYPPGQKIFVKPDKYSFEPHEKIFTDMPTVVNKLKNVIASTNESSSPDLAQLAEAIAEASKLIKTATEGVTDTNIPDSNDLNYCSVKLPPPQPLADIDSEVGKRCFLVCKPQPPPLTVLRDIFCRFGNLINVYTLPNKTVGYARYATVQSADDAIKALHGAEICGIRIKVLEAEEEAPPKRMRYD